MRKYISLNRLVIINFFTIVIGAVFYNKTAHGFGFSVILVLSLLFNTTSVFLAVKSVAVKSTNKRRSVIGRKRLLITLMCTGSIIQIAFFVTGLVSVFIFLFTWTTWTILLLCLQKFCDDVIAMLNKVSGHQHSIGIVGTNERSLQVASYLHNKNKFSVIKYLDEHEPGTYKRNNKDTGSIYSFIDFTKEKGIKELYVSALSPYAEGTQAIIQEAEKHCIRVNFIGAELLPEIPSPHIKYINGMPVWRHYREPLRRTINRLSKRAMDIIVSSLVIIFILSWLIPLIGLLIKLNSKGPVFFRQLRSGRDNNPFVCLKFRSMRVNEESDHKQATYQDSRVTSIGTFLRKTSLDEFPQFINVFKGEMSIVGPRPHMLRHTEEYSKQIKQYMGRLYPKPGITGWAQVNGYRGETINLVLMEKRVEYDIEYMENWSLWFDIKIMALTFWNIIIGEENAY